MELANINRPNIFRKLNTFLEGLVVKNGASFEGDVAFDGDATITGDVTIEGDTLVEGNLTLANTVETQANVGTKNTVTGLTVAEYGDGVNHVTVLTMDEMPVGSPVGAANLAFGKKVYTLPAGAQIIEAVYVYMALKGTTNIVADTPDVGIGSVIASGAVAVLGGTAGFEDYLTGQTSGAISGSNGIQKASGATAGVLTDIAMNYTTSAKTIHLNVADGWAGAGDVTATGRIVLVWKTL